jgi:hypothetical protein
MDAHKNLSGVKNLRVCLEWRRIHDGEIRDGRQGFRRAGFVFKPLGRLSALESRMWTMVVFTSDLSSLLSGV